MIENNTIIDVYVNMATWLLIFFFTVNFHASDSTNPQTHASLTGGYMKRLLLMHSEKHLRYIHTVDLSLPLSYIS